MNLKEAYSILEISPTATPEEAKKKYREFTKKYHPDINKEPGAEDKFKKINEAYQVISTGKSTDREEIHWQPQRSNIHNPFNPFGRQTIHQAVPINLSTTISFKESVIGCKKDLNFIRKTKCQHCNGQGEFAQNNGCDKCGGKGQVTGKNGNMVFIQTCDKCFGRVPVTPCNECQATGVLNADVSINVSIPGGIQDGNLLRLSGMGNFVASMGLFEQHTDAFLQVTVTPELGLSLQGNNVVSTLEISLLEALRGCQKTVKTIIGDKEIKISPRSKNKDEISIPKLGVNYQGDHKIILDIKYPDNINALIDALINQGAN